MTYSEYVKYFATQGAAGGGYLGGMAGGFAGAVATQSVVPTRAVMSVAGGLLGSALMPVATPFAASIIIGGLAGTAGAVLLTRVGDAAGRAAGGAAGTIAGGTLGAFAAVATTPVYILLAATAWRNKPQPTLTAYHDAVKKVNPDAEAFWEFRMREDNRNGIRINHALEPDIQFSAFITWLTEKSGAQAVQELKQNIFPMMPEGSSVDIPDVPVRVAGELYCMSKLTLLSDPKQLLAHQIFVPHLNGYHPMGTIEPNQEAQQAIETLLLSIQEYKLTLTPASPSIKPSA